MWKMNLAIQIFFEKLYFKSIYFYTIYTDILSKILWGIFVSDIFNAEKFISHKHDVQSGINTCYYFLFYRSLAYYFLNTWKFFPEKQPNNLHCFFFLCGTLKIIMPHINVPRHRGWKSLLQCIALILCSLNTTYVI